MTNTPLAGPAAQAGGFTAYVGCYPDPDWPGSGGIDVLAVNDKGEHLRQVGHVEKPQEAGYLVYARSTRTLYAVDERKTDGRGPVHPPGAVHALSAGPDGTLTWLNSLRVPGPFPTYLDLSADHRSLVAASHGSFDHVERIVASSAGRWEVQYVYDDSAVLLYDLATDGQIHTLRDVQVMAGHGMDPNTSPQAGGHGQSGGHAHCAVVDPSGQWVLVADKGTDQIHSYRLGATLELVRSFQFPPETGPRHIAFGADNTAYVTLEFASALASMHFDLETAQLQLIDQVSTVAADHTGLNEPADLRVHPGGRFVYVNNRGEDSLAWLAIGDDKKLTRRGHVNTARSLHPGVAARSFALDPTGSFLLLADRPANLVRSYRVDPKTGQLTPHAELAVLQPAFIALVANQL